MVLWGVVSRWSAGLNHGMELRVAAEEGHGVTAEYTHGGVSWWSCMALRCGLQSVSVGLRTE